MENHRDSGGIHIDKLDERLKEFGNGEYRLLLRQLLKTANQEERLYTLLEMHIEAIYNHRIQAEQRQTYVHLVFSLSNAGSLKVALSKLNGSEGHRVVAFNELFSVGPIADLDTQGGQRNRELWMMEHLPDTFFGASSNQEHRIEPMMETLRKIPVNKTIVIWSGDNAHDQTGLRFALYLLREQKNPVHVVNVSQAHRDMGLSGAAPITVAQGDWESFLEIVKRCGEGIPLQFGLRKQYEQEWLELSSQNHLLRLWGSGDIIGCDEKELDPVIVSAVAKLQDENTECDFIKGSDVVIRVLEETRQLISVSFITYRIWKLVSDRVLRFQGLPWAPHQYSLRLNEE